MRVVIDTNAYISAMMFDGLPGSVLDLAFLHSFTLIISTALLDEFDEKLRLKFEVLPGDAALIRAKLQSVAQVVSPDETLQVIEEDHDDNRVLECAVKGHADIIVSGDRHLLKLGAYQSIPIPIVTVREFIEAVEPGRNG